MKDLDEVRRREKELLDDSKEDLRQRAEQHQELMS